MSFRYKNSYSQHSLYFILMAVYHIAAQKSTPKLHETPAY